MSRPSQPTPPDPERVARAHRRAFILGVVNGALFQMGISFVDPSTVLPAFINELTRSELAVGVMSALAGAGWLLPQLAVARYAQVMPRKLPVYRAAAVVRMASLGALIASLCLFGGRPQLLLPLFLIFYAGFTFAGGAGGISFIDVVAKTIPPYRIGSFFGQRQIYGGILGLFSAAVVRQILREGSPLVFPRNYTYLFVMGAVAIGAGVACFAVINEPPGRVERRRPALLEFLRRAPLVLVEDRDFRGLFVTRLLQGAAVIALPFYVVFAGNALGMPSSMLGVYLGAQTAGGIFSNFLWAPLSDRYGGKRTLVAVAVAAGAAPALAVALALLPLSHEAAGWGFAAVFLLLGCSGSGSSVAYNNYLLEVAPEVMRPTYVGVLNTFSGIVTLMPILGGVLVTALSYQAVFAIALLATLGGLARALRLRDLRDDAAGRFGHRAVPGAGGFAGQSRAGGETGAPEE